MKKVLAFLFAMLLGAAGVWSGYNYHVVRSEKEWLLVPKQRAALTEVFCDVREWGAAQWKEHPDLVRNLVKHGRGELVIDTTARDLLDNLKSPFSARGDRDTDSR